jgi:hypothetical protein
MNPSTTMQQNKGFIASTSNATSILNGVTFFLVSTFVVCFFGMLFLFVNEAMHPSPASEMPFLKALTWNLMQWFGPLFFLLIGSRTVRAWSPLDEKEIEECLIHPWGRDAKLHLLTQLKKNQTIRTRHVLKAQALDRQALDKRDDELRARRAQKRKEMNESLIKKWEAELSA